MSENDRVSSFLLGVMVGGVIGGVTALLLAPTSGKKLRRKISDKAEDFYDEAQEYYESGRGKVEELYKEGRKKVTDIVEDAKKIVSSQ